MGIIVAGEGSSVDFVVVAAALLKQAAESAKQDGVELDLAALLAEQGIVFGVTTLETENALQAAALRRANQIIEAREHQIGVQQMCLGAAACEIEEARAAARDFLQRNEALEYELQQARQDVERLNGNVAHMEAELRHQRGVRRATIADAEAVAEALDTGADAKAVAA